MLKQFHEVISCGMSDYWNRQSLACWASSGEHFPEGTVSDHGHQATLKCHLCDEKSFSRLDNLKRHYKNVHGKAPPPSIGMMAEPQVLIRCECCGSSINRKKFASHKRGCESLQSNGTEVIPLSRRDDPQTHQTLQQSFRDFLAKSLGRRQTDRYIKAFQSLKEFLKAHNMPLNRGLPQVLLEPYLMAVPSLEQRKVLWYSLVKFHEMRQIPAPCRNFEQLVVNWRSSRGWQLALGDCKKPGDIRKRFEVTRAQTMCTFLLVELLLDQKDISFVEGLTIEAFKDFRISGTSYVSESRYIEKDLFETIRRYLAIVRPVLFNGPAAGNDLLFSIPMQEGQSLVGRGLSLFENWSSAHVHLSPKQFEDIGVKAPKFSFN